MSKPEEEQVFNVEDPAGDVNIEDSDRRLMKLGYKPEFRREMSLLGVLGISFCAIGILTGSSAAFQAGLFSGGPLASLVEVGSGRTLTRVQIAAIAWGINILSGVINTIGTKAIGRMSTFNIWWTLGGTFVLVITLLVKAPVKAVYSLEGSETAGQVAEEALRAEFLAPMAVVGSIIGSWIIGLAYMLALLFSVQSITSIQTTSYAIPIAQLYHDAIGTRLTLMCLTVICLAQFMAAVTAFTASSRLYYALARDNAFPAKGAFMALNRFQAPFVGIWMSVLIGCVVSSAYIGSVIAFNAILSSAAIAVMLSYLQPIAIRVFWPSS
ncbi:hypothetical protein HHX47_DHR5000438 [Lentinula edodes]|nr:hypothetical protein HHX47_DHR5000438 [Lentinula edodes]